MAMEAIKVEHDVELEFTAAIEVVETFVGWRFVACEYPEDQGVSCLYLMGSESAHRVVNPAGEPIVLANPGLLVLLTEAFRIYDIPEPQRFFWWVCPRPNGPRVALHTETRKFLAHDRDGKAFWALVEARLPTGR